MAEVGVEVRGRSLTTIAAGLVVLTVAAGCTTSGTPTASGGPTPGSVSGSASSVTSTTRKSQIADPLDLGKLTANVCGGLTDAQVGPYLGPVGERNPQKENNGPVCAILAQGTSGTGLGVGVINIATPNQELLYEAHSIFPWREKISPIAGYPAVDASQGASPTTGDCATDVAVNDEQSLHIQFTAVSPSDHNYSKPCSVSEALMAVLIQNIKSGVA